jgi:hypothetical protein
VGTAAAVIQPSEAREEYVALFLGLEPDSTFHFMGISGRNRVSLPVIIQFLHHGNHRQKHQQNHDDRHDFLPLLPNKNVGVL